MLAKICTQGSFHWNVVARRKHKTLRIYVFANTESCAVTRKRFVEELDAVDTRRRDNLLPTATAFLSGWPTENIAVTPAAEARAGFTSMSYVVSRSLYRAFWLAVVISVPFTNQSWCTVEFPKSNRAQLLYCLDVNLRAPRVKR